MVHFDLDQNHRHNVSDKDKQTTGLISQRRKIIVHRIFHSPVIILLEFTPGAEKKCFSNPFQEIEIKIKFFTLLH